MTRSPRVDQVVYDRGVPDTAARRDPRARAGGRPVQPGRGRARRRGQGAAVRGPLRAARRAPGRRRPVRPRLRGQGGAGGRPHRRAVRGGTGHRPGGRRRRLRRCTADRRAYLRRRGRRDHARLRRAGRRRRTGVRSRVAVDAGDLAPVRDGLLAAGVEPRHPGRGDRRRHRRDAVHVDRPPWTAWSPRRSASPVGWC